MTAESIVRAQHGRRTGRGWMAFCPAHEERTPSLSITEREGKVLVHCHAGCSQAEVITALRARGLWPERERRISTPRERADWARQQRTLERDLPTARCWRRSAVCLCEEALNDLKSVLFDPTAEPVMRDAILNDAIYKLERTLSRLRNLGSASLVAEFGEWKRKAPP